MSTIQLGLLGIIGLGLLLIGITRLLNYKRDKSTGVTTKLIQFTTVLFVIPLIAILALEQIVTPESVAVIYGTIIGFLLSGFDRNEE